MDIPVQGNRCSVIFYPSKISFINLVQESLSSGPDCKGKAYQYCWPTTTAWQQWPLTKALLCLGQSVSTLCQITWKLGDI
ncbi:hypothetical protein J6590_049476 [Homalodisca vitripennis]|nr:hypothetical protein J6590_049476 [Homalodisca vitripennis]